jgi:hypothetical protein
LKYSFTAQHKKNLSISAAKRCTPEWRLRQSMRTRLHLDEIFVCQSYLDGHTTQEIADMLHVSNKPIYNILKRNNIPKRIACKRNQWGENNHAWKGDSAQYKQLHKRIYRRFGNPIKCEVCLTTDPSKSYDWANLTGDYANINDYKRMCRSCHRKYDRNRKEENHELSQSLRGDSGR